MKRYAIAAALALLATVPIVVYAAVAYPSAGRGPFVAGLTVLLLAEAAMSLLGWQLLRRVAALGSELRQERERKTLFEAHSREMYRELERKLEERTTELLRQRDTLVRTEKLTSLSRLVGGVAHELNNPLTAILGEATILRERCNTPELSRGLRVIEQQASRCANLIRDLAAFASIEQRKVQPLDVQALLEGALSQASMVAPGQEVEVVRQYWRDPLVIAGNMEQLQQALTNIISNALQAMANGGPGRLLLRTGRSADGWVRLEVSDTGGGIEAEMLPYIFDPFYSRPQRKPGLHMGMGLSVALGLVQAHGGRIWAESQVGQGTTVFVELPESPPEPIPQEEHAFSGGL